MVVCTITLSESELYMLQELLCYRGPERNRRMGELAHDLLIEKLEEDLRRIYACGVPNDRHPSRRGTG